MKSGAHGNRGLTQPKRGKCPKCGKRGLGPWKNAVVIAGPVVALRNCRYCDHYEAKEMRNDFMKPPKKRTKDLIA